MPLPERGPDGNLFRVPGRLPSAEVFEQVAGGEHVRVERIVSTGQASPPAWGDYVLIPAGERHGVEWTREDPPCIWFAVQFKGLVSRPIAENG